VITVVARSGLQGPGGVGGWRLTGAVEVAVETFGPYSYSMLVSLIAKEVPVMYIIGLIAHCLSIRTRIRTKWYLGQKKGSCVCLIDTQTLNVALKGTFNNSIGTVQQPQADLPLGPPGPWP